MDVFDYITDSQAESSPSFEMKTMLTALFCVYNLTVGFRLC